MRTRCCELEFQKLEPRNLLAGDVFAGVSSSILFVVGDDLDNRIQLSNHSGGILVSGVDTTVNGSAEPLVISSQFQHITISLLQGDDLVELQSISAPSHLTILGGAGGDQAVLQNVSAFHLHIEGGSGADVFHLNGTSISKSSYMYLGSGDDLVAVSSHSTGRNFKVFGGDGNDTFVSDSLGVGRKLSVHLDSGDDRVLLAGNTLVRNRVRVSTGNGNDFVGFLPQAGESIRAERWVSVDTGANSDSVSFEGDTRLGSGSRVDGGNALDQLHVSSSSQEGVQFRNFESNSQSNVQTILDQIFESLAGAGIDPAPFGGMSIEPVRVELQVSATSLEVVENDSPATVDPNLRLTGELQIESARIEITNFQMEPETLAFNEGQGITGEFDSSTGTLVLTGDASTDAYQQVLRSVRYQNTSDDPISGDRVIRFTVFDERSNPVSDDRVFSIQPVDDPLSLSLPAPFDTNLPVMFNLGETVSFTAIGADPDNSLTYQLDLEDSGIPSTATQPVIDFNTGAFEWTPNSVGDFSIRIIAVNDAGDVDQEEFTISI